MSDERPFALLITWTCYGTWLPGDERGHVSPTLLPEGGSLPKQNVPGTPVAKGDAYTRAHAQSLLKHQPVWLTAEQARIVADTLVEAARERGWRILRGAIMRNHVHVVITDCPDDGPMVRRVLKGTTQAALTRSKGQPQRWWTAGGSDRYKHDDDAIVAAVNYVANQKGMLVEIVDMVVREVTGERRGLSPPTEPPG